MFRDESVGVWALWDKAHNTYLETFHGLGLLFGGMLIASVVVLVWECFKGARTRDAMQRSRLLRQAFPVLVGVHMRSSTSVCKFRP